MLVVYSPSLSFWWDEFSLIQAHTQFAYGIANSHMGHFLPLGRLAFAFYVEAFGASYLPMMLINALICFVSIALLFLFIRTTDEQQFLTHLLFAIPVISLISSAGVLYDIQWAMQVCWFLSILFGAFALFSLNLLRNQYLFLALSLFLSWLSLSSNIIGIAILISAIGIWKSKLTFKQVSLILVSSFCLFFIGYIVAKNSHPIDPNAYGSPIDLIAISKNFYLVIELTGVLAMSWLLSPISVFSTSSQSRFYSLGSNIDSVSHLNLVVLLLLFSFLILWILRSEKKHVPLSLLLLILGIVGQSGLIVISRFGFFSESRSSQLQGFLHVRYAPILQLLATFFWMFLLITYMHGRRKRIPSAIPIVILILLITTTAWAALQLPKSIANSSDLGRISRTKDQLIEFKKCGDPSSVFIYGEIQPSIPSPLMCEITGTVSGLND